jgi:hypothetical protein
MKIVYYELVKHEYEPRPNGFATAAVWSCVMCGQAIDGMGGPGNGELCEKCGDDILSRKLKYDRAKHEQAD